MKKILCPIDFTSTALNGLRYAFETAKKLGSELYVLYATHVPLAVQEGMVMQLDYEEEEDEICTKIEQICHDLQAEEDVSERVMIHIFVKIGLAEDAILSMAREEDIELIILGTKGARGFGKLFGTIAADVATKASCPVMIIPDGYAYRELKQIVYATDIKGNEVALIHYLTSFAQVFGAHISFLNIQKKDHEDPEKLITRGVHLLDQTDYQNISFHVFEKEDVVQGINEFAEKRKADLVVMATRERNFLQRTFLKSHTKEEAYQVPLPFMAMHKQKYVPVGWNEPVTFNS